MNQTSPVKIAKLALFRLSITTMAVAVLHLVSVSAVQAQAKKSQVQKLTGKLVSSKKKGRTVTITVDIKGEKYDFVINSRVAFAVTAVGDDGFLKEGAFISTIATESNNLLFAQNYTVHIVTGKKLKSGIMKAPPKPGQSLKALLVAGPIVSRKPHEQFEQYDEILVKAKGNTPLLLERKKPHKITVSMSDISLAKPGATVILEGKPGKGGKIKLTKATVKLPAPLKAETFFANNTDGKKKK